MATSDSITPKKNCSRCDKELPMTAEYFSRHKGIKCGFRPECKECEKQYRTINAEKIHERKTAYFNSHREELKEKCKTRNLEHAEERRAYRNKHAKEKRIYDALYRSTPQGRASQNAHSQRRRAQKKGDGGSVTLVEYEAVLKAHINAKGQIVCAWCGKPIKGMWHFDHWIPLALGGRHEAGNLRVMHGTTGNKCNLKKHATHPFKFGRLI